MYANIVVHHFLVEETLLYTNEDILEKNLTLVTNVTFDATLPDRSGCTLFVDMKIQPYIGLTSVKFVAKVFMRLTF